MSLTDRRFHFTTVNRVRTGTADEPFPQDVRLHEACQIVLARTNLCGSARRFYEHIVLLASKDIAAGTAGDE